MDFDLIIVGGGAAGMMAAISAKRHHPKLSVAIIDRTFALGRKLLVCGAGRCNITNINLNNSFHSRYYSDNVEIIDYVFNNFGYDQINDFFLELGIPTYVERKTNIGKVFPQTDSAKTVSVVLEDEIFRLGVKVLLNTEIENVYKDLDEFRCEAIDLKSNEIKNFKSKYLIISAGGQTYPALGSNGSGFAIAKKFGHNIIKPVPSALPLISDDQRLKLFSGQKMDIEVSSFIDHKFIKKSFDDVMFTEYGLSGPAVLNISREISINFNRNESAKKVFVKLNFVPGYNETELTKLLKSRWIKRSNQFVNISLYGLMPNKIADGICNILNIGMTRAMNMNEKQIDELVKLLINFELNITGTKGWNEAEFTAGGVDTNEVNKNLESKIINNLYFAGEILDVDGDVGGFNLSWAWATGYLAGKLLKC